MSDRSSIRRRDLNTSTPSIHSTSSSPCEAEGRIRELFHNFHIPSPPPHLSVLFTSRGLLVFNEPPCWHVHSSQVILGQRFRPLLNHRHLVSKVAVLEVLSESSYTMRYHWTTRHQTLHLLKKSGERHNTSGRPSPYLIDPPYLGEAYAMYYYHVRLEVRCRHRHTALGATHRLLFPLIKTFFLPLRPLLIRPLLPLPPD